MVKAAAGAMKAWFVSAVAIGYSYIPKTPTRLKGLGRKVLVNGSEKLLRLPRHPSLDKSSSIRVGPDHYRRVSRSTRSRGGSEASQATQTRTRKWFGAYIKRALTLGFILSGLTMFHWVSMAGISWNGNVMMMMFKLGSARMIVGRQKSWVGYIRTRLFASYFSRHTCCDRKH